MIRYALKCANNHQFESWFKSATAFDTLLVRDMVACPECGETDVSKAIMAPRVRTARTKAVAPTQTPDLETMRKDVEANSEYVGGSFATEARAMNDGDTPERSIYGEASLDEAKSLVEDGVPVVPLPFIPTKKTN
jgi:hypothetical protein